MHQLTNILGFHNWSYIIPLAAGWYSRFLVGVYINKKLTKLNKSHLICFSISQDGIGEGTVSSFMLYLNVPTTSHLREG